MGRRRGNGVEALADDVHAVAASGSDVPLTLNELTRQERETFVKLVDSEFRGPR